MVVSRQARGERGNFSKNSGLFSPDFTTTRGSEVSKERTHHFQKLLGKLSGETSFSSRGRSIHPNSLDFLVFHQLSILEILQLELFLTPEIRDLLGVGHSDSATTSESGPFGSTLESQLVPDAVDSGDESRELLRSVERRRSDTETLLADRNGREVCERGEESESAGEIFEEKRSINALILWT